MREPLKFALTLADKAVDPTTAIQGHCGQTVNQRFQTRRAMVLVCEPLSMEAMEHVEEDQFGNLYLQMKARLADGELHTHDAWIGTYRWVNAERRLIPVKEWKKFDRLSDGLFDAFRTQSFAILGERNRLILIARHAAKLPMVTAA